MRKVIVAMQVTLDGFIEGPNGELDWAMEEDEETWKDHFELMRSVDTVLLGRVMYPAYEQYWLAAPTNPSSTKNEIEYARLADKMQKIVFSKTLEKVEWKTTRIVKDHIAEEILRMKQQPGKDMVLLGGAERAAHVEADKRKDISVRESLTSLRQGIGRLTEKEYEKSIHVQSGITRRLL